MFFEFQIPLWIEGAKIVQEVGDSHPLWQFLVFGDVADVRKDLSGDVGSGVAEDLRAAGGRAQDVHQKLDDGRFARAVRANKGVDGILRNGEVEAFEGIGAAVAAGEVPGLDYGGHLRFRPPGSGVMGSLS